MPKLFSLKTLFIAVVAITSSDVLAREAKLLDFTTAATARSVPESRLADKNINGSISVSLFEDVRPRSHAVQPLAVLDLMSAELAMRADRIPAQIDASPFDIMPTAGIRIPAWMKPTRSTLSSSLHYQSAAPFSSNISGMSFDKCDGTGFSPAWWLDPKVESRRAYHFDTVMAVACEYGLPTSLLDAVIAQESGYKYWAISNKGAMGLMQIMPGTASQLGLVDPFNSLANMRAGARYLREQLDRFGRVDLALAAYNAGPHRRSLKAGRLPMISETINYVRSITTNWTRLSPRHVEISSLNRRAIADAAVTNSGYRNISLVRYDRYATAPPF